MNEGIGKLLRRKDAMEADIQDLSLILKNLRESKQKVKNQMSRRSAELKEIDSAIKDLTLPSATKCQTGKLKGDQQNYCARPKIPPPPPRPSCYKCMESGHWPDDCPEDCARYVLKRRDE